MKNVAHVLLFLCLHSTFASLPTPDVHVPDEPLSDHHNEAPGRKGPTLDLPYNIFWSERFSKWLVHENIGGSSYNAYFDQNGDLLSKVNVALAKLHLTV